MAISKCGKCNGTIFELKEQSPAGSNYKFFFVQCSLCGVPITALEYFNNGAKIDNLKKEVTNLEKKIDSLDHILRQIKGNF